MALFGELILLVCKLIFVCVALIGCLLISAIIWAANDIDGLSAISKPATILPIAIILWLLFRRPIARMRAALLGPF